MQKKIIALAVAAALAAPALAMADVTVYGKADLAVGNINNGTVSSTQMTSQITKLGFKGNEDLGDGLNAIWQIEQQIDINNAGSGYSTKNSFAGRNSFLGLKSESAGTVMLGRHDTPYKESTRGLDVFGDQFADNRHLMGGASALPVTASGALPTSTNSYNVVNSYAALMDARPTNELMYVSPNMSGFTVKASYVLSNDTLPTSGTTGATLQKGHLWAMDGEYKAGPLFAALAYSNIKYGTTGAGTAYTAGAGAAGLGAGDSIKAWKAGVGYDITDAFKLNAIYEKLTSSIANPTAGYSSNMLGRTDWYLAGVYKFNSDDVKLAYTKAGNTDGHANTGAKMIGVGYDHYMSKRTSVYVMYNKLSNDSAAAYGFNTQATTGAASPAVTGASLSGFLVGMKHVF